MGGLGILEMEKFTSTLRLRWLWLFDTSRPWELMEMPCNMRDVQLFQACTKITVGDGKKKLFFGKTIGYQVCARKILLPTSSNWQKKKNRKVET